MKYGWMACALILAACGGSSSQGERHSDYRGNVSTGATCESVLYDRGRPAKIEYPGPNIEEWIYVAETMPPQRDDTIVPNPFPRDVANVKTTRTIYRFEHRVLVDIIELQPGQHRKR
jgi:hypothetical protein